MKKVFKYLLLVIFVVLLVKICIIAKEYLSIKTVEIQILNDNHEYVTVNKNQYDEGKIKLYYSLTNKNKTYDVQLAIIGKYKLVINDTQIIYYDIYENEHYASYNDKFISINKKLADYLKTIILEK